MLHLHRVLFCTGIDLDDVMQIDCLAYKYFVFNRFSLVGYNIWCCVVCDYRGTPPPQKKKKTAEFASIPNQSVSRKWINHSRFALMIYSL